MRFVAVVSLALLGCRVEMGEGLLEGSLFLEVRRAEVISALCARPMTDAEVTEVSTDLKVDQIRAERSLFGKEGHGSAHVEFKPARGATCNGSVEFDFTQDSRVTHQYKRSVQHSSSFAYSNLVVKHP